MKLGGSELRSLIGVEDLRRPVLCDRFLQSLDAEVGGHAVGDAPAQDLAAEPVHNGHQIHEATGHGDIGHVGRPHLVWPIDDELAQQVWVDQVSRMPPTRVRTSVKRLDAHFAHQRRYMPAADDNAFQAQDVAQHPAAQERPLQVQLIKTSHELQIRCAGGHRLVIQRGARKLQQLCLARQTQFVCRVNHRLALDPGSRPSAPTKKSFSSASCPIFACRVLISGPASAAGPEPLNASAARSSNWFFHLNDLIRMHIEPSGQLRQGLFALDRSHCHFGLECRRMIAAGSLRHKSPSFQAISSLGLDGVATYPVVSRSGASSVASVARFTLFGFLVINGISPL
jgi:hypothetical protein